MKCKKCGSEIDEAIELCPYCGEKIEKRAEVSDSSETEQNVGGTIKCAYCGSVVDSDSNNCPYCGMKVDHHADDITTVIPASNGQAKSVRFASYRRGSDSINSIIFAGVSIALCIVSYFILGFLSLAGLGLSISGLILAIKARKNGDNAVVGLILSIIALVLSIIMVILYIIAVVLSMQQI